jgi:hypothetical protein
MEHFNTTHFQSSCFDSGKTQVAAMCVYDHKLYVGTSWGCLIIAEAYSMRPITVFRCPFY